jgi:putative membrane protein
MRFSIPKLGTGSLVLIAGMTLVGRAGSEAQQQLDDGGILAVAEFAHTAELETGQLAQEKGSGQEVKDLGRNLVTAHTQARNEARALGNRLNLSPRLETGDPMARAHSEAMTRLRGLEGKTFDKAYIDHEVSFHQAVIEKVKTSLIPAAKSPELKAYLNKLTPSLQAHLEEARALQGRIVAAD